MHEFYLKHKSLIDKILIIVSFIAISIFILSIIATACYSYPCEDDFSFETGVIGGTQEYGSALLGAIMCTKGYATIFQGTYLSCFLYFLIGPYHRWGITGFHIMMILLDSFFLYALYFLCKSIFEDKAHRFIAYALALCATFEMRGSLANTELFVWYSGAINYTLVLSLSFIATGIYIKLFRDLDASKQKRSIILCSIAAFFAGWGNLEITAINCSLLLIVLLSNFKSIKTQHRLVVPFIYSLISALSNALCPGNFSRSKLAVNDTNSSIWDAIIDTFGCYSSESRIILGSSTFVLILIICFIIGMAFNILMDHKGMTLRSFLFYLISAILAQLIVIFPVVFGYHSDNLASSRTQAAYEIIARLLYMFVVFCLAQLLCESKYKYCRYLILALSGVSLIGFLLISKGFVNDFKDGYTYRIVCDMHNDNLRTNYIARIYALSTMEMAEPGSDLYIEIPNHMIQTMSMYGMGLSDDPNNIVNVSAATLFDLNSVVVVYP